MSQRGKLTGSERVPDSVSESRGALPAAETRELAIEVLIQARDYAVADVAYIEANRMVQARRRLEKATEDYKQALAGSSSLPA